MRRSLIPAATLVAAMAGSLALAPIASASSGVYELKQRGARLGLQQLRGERRVVADDRDVEA
ncbi:hypothetical protein, partial [Streptomyces anthocyanicus]|uniref:hypothetical protein n=1 Tax=Streptomyces anthocyanicus TaxID=68174 RepID=UPI003655629D